MNTLKLLTLVKIYINTYICQALARYSDRSYCKGTGRVLKKKISSAGLRRLIDISSNLLRACVAPSSGLLRLLFDCPSGVSRSSLEAEPKPSRSVAEHVSNESRRRPEALPKPSQRGEAVAIPIRLRLYFTYICQALAGHANTIRCKGAGRLPKNHRIQSSELLLTNTCLSSAFYAAGSQFSSGQHRRGPKKNWSQFEENPRKGRSWSGVGRELISLFLAVKSTIASRLSYWECTEGVLKRYWKGTKELRKRYQIATKQVRAFGSFRVNLRYKLGRATEIPAKMQHTDLVSEVGGYALKLKGLRAFYGLGARENKYLGTQRETGAQKALKYVISRVAYKRSFRMLLTCLISVFHMFSLSAQTPRKDSGADGLSNLVALKPGDRIPDAVWNQSLELNYFNGKKTTIKFAELKGKLIILDFWSTGCKACIEGIPKMEQLQQHFKDSVAIILVNSKRNKDTQKRINIRFQKYKDDFKYIPVLPTLLDDTIFTKLFEHNTLPSAAVINRAGEFIAITNSKSLSDESIGKLYKGKSVHINNIGLYNNAGKRGGEAPLFDTVGVHFLSAFSSFRARFLPVYPNLVYENGSTYLKMGNQSFGFLLRQAYSPELKGFNWNDAVFDSKLGHYFKTGLRNVSVPANQYWYEFYARDSISKARFEQIFKEDFQQAFKVSVEIKEETVDIYQVTFSNAIKNIVSQENMRVMNGSDVQNKIYYQRIPVENIIKGLYYAFDRPIEIIEESSLLVDITIPAGFVDWDIRRKIDFLKDKGIVFTATKKKRKYPYIFSLK